MKRLVCFCVMAFLLAAQTNSQNAGMAEQKPYIEITGTSESEITPDEIHVSIILEERMENKEKVMIDKQEQELKRHLKELNIDLSALSLNNAVADYRQSRKKNKDVMNTRYYTLKLGNPELISSLYDRFDQMDVRDAYISKLHHSKMTDHTKENRIKAIKAAKDKAEYLLVAAGKKAGDPLYILETDNSIVHPYQGYRGARAAQVSNMMMYEKADVSSEPQVGIQKIKIVSSYLVRYEILNK